MNYRYPGPQSFTEEEEALFFGRTRETKALYDLIMVQPLVVLFAKSGMGKTSLLQAGIIPRLRFTEYDPILIRLNDVLTPPEQQALKRISFDAKADSTLWTEIIRYNREHNGTPMIIFDQFEEVFTLYSDEQRAAFVRQLADVINGSLPENIRQHIREGLSSGQLDTNAVAELERLPRVKIVLSIRSDLLHFLHLLSPEIPSILRNRFELLGLRPEQAREAIINPAAKTQASGDYASQTFDFSEPALAQIINYLSRRRQTTYAEPSQQIQIESSQLQLLCEYIEQKVITEQKGATINSVFISPEFYGGEAGIEQIVSQFYTNTLAAIPDSRQIEKARRLLEDHLMKNERRVSVDKTTITATYGVAPETLDLLVNKRLLRQDVRETGEYFEISHDTLLSAILKSKHDWEVKQAAKKRNRLAAAVLGLLLVVAATLTLVVWAFRQRDEARVALQKQFESVVSESGQKIKTSIELSKSFAERAKYLQQTGNEGCTEWKTAVFYLNEAVREDSSTQSTLHEQEINLPATIREKQTLNKKPIIEQIQEMLRDIDRRNCPDIPPFPLKYGD